MDIELQEIRNVVAQHDLFAALPAASLDDLVGKITIHYLRRGQPFPPGKVKDKQLYLIRSGAITIRDQNGNLIEKLAENETYIEACLEGQQIRIDAVVNEDSLVYAMPCSIIQQLRNESTGFDKFFSRFAEQRMKHAVEAYQQRGDAQSSMRSLVKDLVDREPVMIAADETIPVAARRMTEEQVSSALIMDKQRLVGMLTDRDMRSRYIAKDLSPDTAVKVIMTPDLITVDDKTLLSEALLIMTRNQIHHLPILKDHKPVG
ncbi:MAG: CBS domain-containing protein, partial [Thioalkalispiraceae bacterium]